MEAIEAIYKRRPYQMEVTFCKFANIGGRTRVVPEHGNILRGIPVFTDDKGSSYVYMVDSYYRNDAGFFEAFAEYRNFADLGDIMYREVGKEWKTYDLDIVDETIHHTLSKYTCAVSNGTISIIRKVSE